ncbi:MAG: putative teichuronic acid biosynthesis glycosyltransferase TuaC [Bacteroidetes bacterium ADurb.Bin408]|nr:MAG: putative teichuronic acid biosynthesis glycosyltransferase TuaC [Bacteroidetes bacterium ADurb.Bin408]
MKKKEYILFLSSWYPTRVNPTLGNFNEKFAQAAALHKFVVAFHVCADATMQQPSELVKNGSKPLETWIYYFRKKEKEKFFDRIVKVYRFYKYYIKGFNAIKKAYGLPQIIHLNILYPVGLMALYLKWRYRIPYIVSEHWTGYLPANKVTQGVCVRLAGRYIAKNAELLLPVTEDLKQAMIAEGFRNNYKVVPNVTDTRLFYPDFNRKIPDKKIILHVSSLKDGHKNISGILRVMKKLFGIRADFELHIVGDGDAAPHIKMAEEMGLNARCVFFFNAMTTEQVAEKMRQSDFFLLFSHYENLPCVLVEAFASGLPVVSTTAGGIAEHLNDERGITLKPGDEGALLAACISMLDNVHTYNKEQLHQYAVAHFSYDSVGKTFTDIYNSYRQV